MKPHPLIKTITYNTVAFTNFPRAKQTVTVDALRGTVLVWDEVAGHFTACHILSDVAIEGIIKKFLATHGTNI